MIEKKDDGEGRIDDHAEGRIRNSFLSSNFLSTEKL